MARPGQQVITIRLADVEKFRLFMWGLRQIEVDMHSQSKPGQPLYVFADKLDKTITRFAKDVDHKEGEPNPDRLPDDNVPHG